MFGGRRIYWSASWQAQLAGFQKRSRNRPRAPGHKSKTLDPFVSLHAVPCIFLGGLSDEVVIMTGTEMGIEDAMTKPVSDQALIAIIKDTIKRD
jgi:PleD family two-component response regulator